MEHLSIDELITAFEICSGTVGTCEGCPNAQPGSLDAEGYAACRMDLQMEAIRIIKELSGRRSTASLVEDLAKREGVTKKIAEPYQDEQIMVNGPATVLIITD